MKRIDAKGFYDESNRIMQRCHDEAYIEGMERARSLVRRFMKPMELERTIKTVVFNSNGHMTLDQATRSVLNTLPTEGLYDMLFGGDDE